MYRDNAFVEAWCVGAFAMASAALFICQMFSVRNAQCSEARTPPAGSCAARHGCLRKGFPDPSREVTSPGGQSSGYWRGRVGWCVPEMYLAVPCNASGCDGQRSAKPLQASLSAHLAPRKRFHTKVFCAIEGGFLKLRLRFAVQGCASGFAPPAVAASRCSRHPRPWVPDAAYHLHPRSRASRASCTSQDAHEQPRGQSLRDSAILRIAMPSPRSVGCFATPAAPAPPSLRSVSRFATIHRFACYAFAAPHTDVQVALHSLWSPRAHGCAGAAARHPQAASHSGALVRFCGSALVRDECGGFAISAPRPRVANRPTFNVTAASA
jgi:hypothetical protein